MDANELMRPLKFKKQVRPEPNRLIKIHGCDWTHYEAIGKFIPFKKGSPKKLLGKSRFCLRLPDGTFEVDRDAWLDGETWEYIDEATKEDFVTKQPV